MNEVSFSRRMLVRVAFIVLLVSVLGMAGVSAQSVSLPYFNGWENPDENKEWRMNEGLFDETAAPNRWYVSTKEHFNGGHCLLVSNLGLSGGDTSAVYSNHVVNVVAAREIQLPRGTYDLSFAWKCYGELEADGLYVAWIDPLSDINTSISRVHSWVADALPYKGRMFNNRSSWKVNRTTLTSTGAPMLLAFLWVNNNETAATLSCCIDDIQIAPVSDCGVPSGITHTVNGNYVTLSWTASSQATYEVRYNSEYTGVNDTVRSVRGGSLSLPDMPNGLYNFYIRTICAPGDTSIWYEHLGVIVNDGLCLDYTNLEGAGVTCYLGADTRNPYTEIRIDRDGIDGAPSRHTVNIDASERDPMTGGMLTAIPPGDFTSVRLGNWANGHSEAIDYTLRLDSGSNIVLLMKYAVVLEVPDGHTPEVMPKFRLELMDGVGDNAQLIDPDCGKIDFYADMSLVGKDGWLQAEVDREEPVIYKDWTTIGVNLSEYAKTGARDIHVRLSTNDCGLGAHFGYAYFTLACTGGEIQGVACGDVQTEEIAAPEGFRYRWYKTYDPDAPVDGADQRKLDIENNDTATYSCDVMSLETDCQFTLTASLMPRYPKAMFDVEWIPSGCTNAVRFNNLSRVETVGGKVLPEQIESFEWTLDDGTVLTDKSFVMPLPDEGGDVHIRLRADISGGCWDMIDTTVHVVAIGPVFDTTDVTICADDNYYIDGTAYNESGYYSWPPVKSFSGCDSTSVVHLTVVDGYEVYMDTAICHGDTLDIAGGKYYFSSDELPNGEFLIKAASASGCDSVIHLRLNVMPEVTFGVDVRNAADGPLSGSIAITDTAPGTYYTLNGELNARTDSLAAGVYTVVCFDSIGCSSEPLTVEITAECAEVELLGAGEICGSEDSLFRIPVNVLSGKVSHCALRFGDKARAAGFADADSLPLSDGAVAVPLPDSVRPDLYTVSVEIVDRACGAQTFDYDFTVLYPASIVRQKWNNVLAVTNEDYNGGYTFSSFRWFCNGSPVPGAAGSYLYLGEDAAFDTADVYHVELTRADDGVTLPTCPVIPSLHTDIMPYPAVTVAAPMQGVRIRNVSAPTSVALYSVTGQTLWSGSLSSGADMVRMPDTAGVYLLVLVTGGERRAYKVVVR